MKKTYFTLVLALATGVLFMLALGNANAIDGPATLHFYPGVSSLGAQQARSQLTQREYTLWPTFYYQSQARIAGGNIPHTANALMVSTVGFSGDFHHVWQAPFVAGAAPSAIDGHGVAISASLAHQLFGSINVDGMLIEVDGAQRVIRGVFADGGGHGNPHLAILPYSIEDGEGPQFTTAALHWPGYHPTKEGIQNLAISIGLPSPTHITLGGPAAMARFMAWLPVGLVAVAALLFLVRQVKGTASFMGWPLALAILVAVALALPILLEYLPPWAVPTFFGDFAFWGRLVESLLQDLRSYLGAPPTLQSIHQQMALLRQVGLLVISLPVATALCMGLSIKK